VVLVLLLFLQNCSNPTPKERTVIIPSKQSEFKAVKPTVIKVPVYKYKTLAGKTIKLTNPINEELARNFEQLQRSNDSLKLKLVYFNAIQIRKYEQNFNDKNLNATVYAQTTGTLDSLKLKYTIKADTIVIKPKESVFALYVGAGAYSDLTSTKFKVNVGIQNRKGNILGVGYDPFSQAVFVDYSIRLINIKK
jgi:hypothetical protein